MGLCFQLFRLQDTEKKTPLSLNLVDTEICAALGEPVDERTYCRNWFNVVGLSIALGMNWQEIHQDYLEDERMLPVIEFMSQHYLTDAWRDR